MKKRNIKYLSVFISCSLISFLTACDSGQWRSSDSIVESGWAEPPTPYNPDPLYCYKTLAGNDCYKKPLQNQETRLESYYGPEPIVPETIMVIKPTPHEIAKSTSSQSCSKKHHKTHTKKHSSKKTTSKTPHSKEKLEESNKKPAPSTKASNPPRRLGEPLKLGGSTSSK